MSAKLVLLLLLLVNTDGMFFFGLHAPQTTVFLPHYDTFTVTDCNQTRKVPGEAPKPLI